MALSKAALSQESNDHLYPDVVDPCALEDCGHSHDLDSEEPCQWAIVDEDGHERPCGCKVCTRCKGYRVVVVRYDRDGEAIEKTCPRCDGTGRS